MSLFLFLNDEVLIVRWRVFNLVWFLQGEKKVDELEIIDKNG